MQIPIKVRNQIRDVLIGVGVIAAVLLLVVIGLWFTLRVEIVQWAVHRAMQDAGIKDSTATVTEVTTSHTVIVGIEAPGLGHIDSVEIDYSLADLFTHRLDRLVVYKPTLELALDTEGRPTGELGKLLGAGTSGGLAAPSLPVDTLHIEEGVVVVLGGSNVELTVDGRYHLGSGDAGKFAWHAMSRWGDIGGDATLTGVATGAAPRVELTFKGAGITWRDVGLSDTSGTATVTLGKQLGVVTHVAAKAATLGGKVLGPLDASATWAGGRADLELDIGNAGDPVTAHLGADLLPKAGGQASWSLSGLLAVTRDLTLPLSGAPVLQAPARAELQLAGTMPADATSWSQLTGGGTVHVQASGLDAASLADCGALTTTAKLDLADGVASLTLPQGSRVAGLRLHVPLTGPVGDALARAWDVTVPDGGARISLRARKDGYGVDAKLRLQAAAADGTHLDGNGQATLRLASDGSLVSGSVDGVELAADGLLLGDALKGTVDVKGSGHGDANELSGRLDIEAKGIQTAFDGLRASGASVTLPLRLARQGGGPLSVSPTPVALVSVKSLHYGDVAASSLRAELPLALSVDRKAAVLTLTDTGWLDIGGLVSPRVRLDDATSMALKADSDQPVLSLAHGGDNPQWEVNLDIGKTGAALSLLDDSGAVAADVKGTLPAVALHLRRLGASHVEGNAEADGGDLKITGPDVALANLTVRASYNSGLSPWPQISIRAPDIHDLESPARFAPAKVDATITPVWPSGKAVRLSADLHMAGLRYMANLEASYEPVGDRIKALLRMPPVHFGPGLQPADLSPLYGKLLTKATGSVDLTGSFGRGASGSHTDLGLHLKDVSGMLAGIPVKGIEASLGLDGLMPLSSPPAQTLRIASLDPGVPLTDIALTYALPGDGTLAIKSGSLHVAGGTVSLPATSFDPKRPENRVTLHVAGVDLAALLTMADLPDAEATGRLSGTIPLAISHGDVAIEHGHLASEGPGILRYAATGGALAAGGGNANVELVKKALSNFHYQTLAIDMDRAAGGSTAVSLHIHGANPDVYDGQPIQLNVNLSGDLEHIIRDSLLGWRIPEVIRQKLSGF